MLGDETLAETCKIFVEFPEMFISVKSVEVSAA